MSQGISAGILKSTIQNPQTLSERSFFSFFFLPVENTHSLVLKLALTVGLRILISRDKAVNQKGCLVYSLLIGVH